jgi:hypothetical protein
MFNELNMKLKYLKIAMILVAMTIGFVAKGQSIVSKYTFTGCIADDVFQLTGGPYTSITWSLSTNGAFLEGKLPYQPQTITNSDLVAFNWNPDFLNESDVIVLRADYTKGSTTGSRTISLTYKGPTTHITPVEPVYIYPNQTVTLTTNYKSTYTYAWGYYMLNSQGWGIPTAIPGTTNTTTVSKAGEYYVRVSNASCNVSAYVDVTGVLNDATVAGDVTVCSGQTVTLTATGNFGSITGGTFNWYSGRGDQFLLSTGLTYTTPVMSSSQSFYVKAYVPDKSGEPMDGSYISNGFTTINVNVLQSPQVSKLIVSKNNPLSNELITANIANPQANVKYTFNWGDGKKTVNTSGTASHAYSAGGNYVITLQTTLLSTGCTVQETYAVTVSDALCVSAFPSASGTFKIDKLTGNIVFTRNDCPVQSILTCVNGPATIQPRVVKAEATTFSDEWMLEDYPHVDNAVKQNPNQFQKGDRGKWRVQGGYKYNTSLIAENKNFKEGTFYMQTFNWSNPDANNKNWLLQSNVVAYSPNGDALQERNALGIDDAAKFGYDDAVPYLLAKNSSYKTVLFESFEYVYPGSTLEDNMKVAPGAIEKNVVAHSGLQSLSLTTGNYPSQPILLNDQISSKGLLVKMWVRFSSTAPYATLAGDLKISVADENLSQIVAPQTVSIVARTGEWTLVETTLASFGSIGVGNNFVPVVQYSNASNSSIWIDDLRMQPADAEMTCYVYNPNTLKLVAILDDQHFGTYYQYNGEGKLIRKMLETERGLKTIQETLYNSKLTTP